MSEVDQRAVAQTVAERREVRLFTLPDLPEAPPSFDEAYLYQDAYVAGVADEKAGIGGFKLAVNGAAQMAHFKVDQPVSARLFADEIYESGVALPSSGFHHVCVEPELAAVIGPGIRDVKAPVDREGAMAAIARFHAAIELVDQRGASLPKIKLAQGIGLNVFNAGIVLGAGSVTPQDLSLPGLAVSLSVNGAVTDETVGTAPQDPVEAVMWLINHLAPRNLSLAEGMVVMCGTHIPLKPLPEGAKAVDVEMSGLGKVSFTLT
ncbi:MAG: 2-oxo-hepta-3-ene-1,7-dioic acid hydratase [Acuticoccus sp.]